MAISSERSSSSPTVAGRTSPRPRNSESGNPLRRSFSGKPFSKPSLVSNPRSFNPITPANSPSDFPPRNSAKDHEKENGEDQNPKVVRGRKHFMSPTISAASKIAISPRKKILGDRNEPVRSSLSFSDFKSSSLNSVNPGPDSALEIGSISAIDAPAITPKASKTVRFADFEAISCFNDDSESQHETVGEPDCVNLDSSFKISPVSSPIIAPLDADPLMAPYDPKTNYLSPRPQFLHYRPNPRIERYLSKEPDGDRLEDFFFSGSFSESEVSEQTESENSQKEPDEASSMEMEKEPDEALSVEMDKEEESATLMQKEEEEESSAETEKEEEDEKVEQCSMTAIIEEKIEEKVSLKPQNTNRRIGALVSLLLIVSFSISAVDYYDPNLLERPKMFITEDSHQFYEFAKTNYDGLVGKFKVWSSESFSFVSDFIFNPRGATQLNYFNLTDLYNDEQCLVFDRTLLREEENNLIGVHFEAVEREFQIKSMEEEREVDDEAGEIEKQIKSMEGEADDESEGREKQMNSIVEEREVKDEAEEREEMELVEEREVGLETVERDSNQINSLDELIVEREVDSQTVERENQIDEKTESADDQKDDEISAQFETEEPENVHQINTEIPYPSPETSDSNVEKSPAIVAGTETGHLPQNLALISGFLLILLAIIPVYARRVVTSKPNLAEPPLSKEKTSHQSAEEFSGSSEMSSFQSSAKGGSGSGAWSEAQSHEKKTARRNNSRRESQASSSMEEFSMSPSYGSFTTYERIPIKTGNGEEDSAVTPVRRSSRIRKQISSP